MDGTELAMAELPGPVADAALALARRMLRSGRVAGPAHPEVVACEPLQPDGGGNTLLRISMGTISLVTKGCDPDAPITLLLGTGTPLECRLFESGMIHAINAGPGIEAPTVGVVRSDGEAWLLMEDVREDIHRWENRLSQGATLAAERLLFDRLARFHVAWESPRVLRRLRRRLSPAVTSERRLRWGEAIYPVWIGERAPDPAETPQLRRARESYAWLGGHIVTFLDSLPESDRTLWRSHMFDREHLVAASRGLPETLVHGDVTLRNVGIRPGLGAEGEGIVLIDWELCGPGTAAFEVVHFLGNVRLRETANSVELVDYYYERYRAHGGRTLDEPTWRRSVSVALVQYGVSLFPAFAGMALSGQDPAARAVVAPMVERVLRAMADLGL